MVAHRTLGTHRCEPDTPLADNRSNDLRFVSMRALRLPATLAGRLDGEIVVVLGQAA
jgi:hypothetical protein